MLVSTSLNRRTAFLLVPLLGIGSAPTPQAASPLALPVVRPKLACAALTALDISQAVGAATRVESSASVDDGKVAAYCNVKVVIDDYARFELHLPATTWTQRMLFGGGPGAQTATGMKLDQFATVSWEDLGRRRNEDVLADNYRAQVNAGYRAMHWQVLAAKALIAQYYGQGPRYSYYNACSNPGREGMILAQRFPGDFDGIGAGCPPINITLNNGLFHAWNVLTNTGPDGQAILTQDKLPILHRAVLERCDAADGVKDGIVSEPFACTPPLDEVTCKPGQDAATCLSAVQVRVARELYRGVHDSAGTMLAPGGVLPGSELAWTATIVPGGRGGGPAEARNATERAIRSHYSLPALAKTWKLDQVRFDRATFDATTRLHYLHDGINTDLSGYAKAGGKLMLWMNLGDTNVLPGQVIHYYQQLQRQMGAKAVDGFARFYVLPGAYHCGGGEGPVIADLLEPLMAWVERGVAPDALAGVHIPRTPGAQQQGAGSVAAAPNLTRPIYPYPNVAKYTGKGDIRDAANYVRGPARPAPSLANWAGAELYRPGATKWCTETANGLSCRDSR